MLFDPLPGALSAVNVAVSVVFAGMVFLPLLQTVQVKVPSVWPFSGLFAVELMTPASGTKGTWCDAEQASADAGWPTRITGTVHAAPAATMRRETSASGIGASHRWSGLTWLSAP